MIPLLLAATLILTWWNGRKASLVIAILNRWLRWITFSLAAAFLSISADWFAKPFWILVLAFFLVWFLFETIYHWIAIKALSQSSVPLFPEFKINPQGEEWPAQKKFFILRRWLKENNFQSICSLKAELVSEITLRMHVYQSEDAKHRIQILFIPQRYGIVNMCFTIVSQTVEKSRFVTDNMFLPFGGFYPENWLLDRKPLARNLLGLYNRHLQRLTPTAHFIHFYKTTDPVRHNFLRHDPFRTLRLTSDEGHLHFCRWILGRWLRLSQFGVAVISLPPNPSQSLNEFLFRF